MAETIRPNRVKELLKQGKVVFGCQSFTNEPAFVEVLGWSGYDFCIIDTEHAPTGVGAILPSVRACELTGMTPMMRTYDLNPGLICKALDMGTQGICVPHVRTASQAEALVQAVKYPPIGGRSGCPLTRHVHYGQLQTTPDKLIQHYRKENEDLLVILLIEDAEAVRNLPEILKVKGVDIVYFGAGDYCHSVGIPGSSYDHPKLFGALKEVCAMCNEAGVAVMSHLAKPISLSDAAYVKTVIEAGVKLIYLHSDISLFGKAAREAIKIRELVS